MAQVTEVDFELEDYTPPQEDEVDFVLEEYEPPEGEGFVSISASAPDEVTVGDTFDASVFIDNQTGDDQTFDATITLSDELSTEDDTTKTTDTIEDEATDTVEWSVDAIDGGSATITIDVVGNETGQDDTDSVVVLVIDVAARKVNRKVINRKLIN